MPDGERRDAWQPLTPGKFQDDEVTLDGSARAYVTLRQLQAVWFNTGTLCNITCRDCYIESSPRNDRLVYLTIDDVRKYLEEISAENFPVQEIGFTGGEPFMNPDLPLMLEASLSAGYRVLVLTNAMMPLLQKKSELLVLQERYGGQLTMRVSIDHPTKERHEELRGTGTWAVMRQGLIWLSEQGFSLNVAGRTRWHETEGNARAGYARLFDEWNLSVDAENPTELVLFPEMDIHQDVPEITTSCWNILDVSPDAMMCASSRMVVKRKGAEQPAVVACTLLPYDSQFELGATLAESSEQVHLNHPHCARFCVLGGGACSVAEG